MSPNHKANCNVACCADFPLSHSTGPLPCCSSHAVGQCLMKDPVRSTSVQPPLPRPLIPPSAEQWWCQAFLSCEQCARLPDIHEFRSCFFPPYNKVISKLLHYRSSWSFIFTITGLERGLRYSTFPSSSKSSISNKNRFTSHLFRLLS